MKKLLFLCGLLPLFHSTAQDDLGPYGANGVGGGEPFQNVPLKRMIPYEHVREADVLWSRRIWRAIDLREKINHPMYFPLDDFDSRGSWVLNTSRYSLWTILRIHILRGNLTLFSPYNPYQFQLTDGDQFKYPVAPESGKNFFTDENYRQEAFQYLGKLGPQSVVPIPAADGSDSVIINAAGIPDYVYPPRDTNWFTSKDIVEYRIKEDCFFDKERSSMETRIIGICPVIYERDESGAITGKRELFWLYFPECRRLLANYYVYNDANDAQWMSFDDLFLKRRFSSYIYKESNAFDRKIESYLNGADAIRESEKISEEIRNFEHDLWNF